MVHKFMLGIILGMFLLVPMVSAFEFDNTLRYENNDMKVTIVNAWGLPFFGSDLGSIELKSHKSVDEILKFGYGKEEVVMYYDFTEWELYKDGLGEVEFTDMRTGKIIDKDYYFVEWAIEERTRDIYDKINCKTTELNGTKTNCDYGVVGQEPYMFEGWLNYSSKDIPNRDVRIGLKTYVGQNDYIDGVWTIAGKQITKHSEWTASLNVDIISHYAGNNLEDSLGLNNLTNSGVTFSVGKIGNAFDFKSSESDYMYATNDASLDLLGDFSMNFWYKAESWSTYNPLIAKRNGADQAYQITVKGSGSTISFEELIDGGATYDFATGGISTGSWYMITLTFDTDGNINFHINNNSLTPQAVTSSIGENNINVFFGRDGASGTYYIDGILDEFSIWNRTLSSAEVGQLYNSGDGITFRDVFNPVINITFPLNITYNNTLTQLNYTTSGEPAIRCWNSIDGGVTNSTDVIAGNNFTLTSSPLVNNWTVYCNNSLGNVRSNDVTFFVNKSVTTELITPLDNADVNFTFNNFVINSTPSNTDLTNVTLYVWHNNGTLFETNFTTLSGTSEVQTTLLSNITIDGIYLWNAETCGDDVPCAFASSNRTLEVHSTPSNVIINFPKGTIDYFVVGQNLTLNWSITEPGQNLTEHIKNCSYTYNGVETFLPNVSVCIVTNTTSFPYVEGVNNLTFTVLEEFNLTTTNSTSWNIQLLQTDTIYEATTIETASETFIFVGEKNSTISSIGALFWYNGGSYVSTTTTSGTDFNLTNTIEIPTGDAGNKSFFWQITSTGTLGTINVNTTALNQTVSNLSIAYCESPSIDGLTLNFTTYDSSIDTILNASIGATFTYFAEGGGGSVVEEYNYESIDENKSNWLFCLSSSGINVTLDATVSYVATAYDRREYIFNDAIIGNFTQDIPLFLSPTIDTDIVTIIVKDQNYNALVGALVNVQEWNVGTNTYTTIGMLTTSSEGNGIINLELYNIWYRAIVIYQGDIVEVTDVQKLSDTTWAITVELGIDNPYDLFGTISHGLTFDNVTNITTFTWSDTSGYTQQGCLEIQNLTTLGYVTISNECTTSVAAIINYQIVGNGEYIIIGSIELTDTYGVSDIVDTLSVRLGTPSLNLIVSSFGKILSLIFIGTASFIGISATSPIWGVLLLMLSIFLSNKLGWLNITTGIFWSFISIAIIIVFRISRRGT